MLISPGGYLWDHDQKTKKSEGFVYFKMLFNPNITKHTFEGKYFNVCADEFQC